MGIKQGQKGNLRGFPVTGWGLWSGICVVFGFVHKYSRGRGCSHNITFCFLDCPLRVLYNSFAAGLDRGLEGFGAGVF